MSLRTILIVAGQLADPAAADLLANTAVRRTLAPIRRMLGLSPARKRRPAAAAAPAQMRKPPPRPDPIPLRPTLDKPPRRPRRLWWLPPPRLHSG